MAREPLVLSLPVSISTFHTEGNPSSKSTLRARRPASGSFSPSPQRPILEAEATFHSRVAAGKEPSPPLGPRDWSPQSRKASPSLPRSRHLVGGWRRSTRLNLERFTAPRSRPARPPAPPVVVNRSSQSPPWPTTAPSWAPGTAISSHRSSIRRLGPCCRPHCRRYRARVLSRRPRASRETSCLCGGTKRL